MFWLAHRFIRGAVLACMVLLAGTASCSSDSYDPDPYDDIPPVVTVEFNYVVPSRVSIRRPQSQSEHQLSLYSGDKSRQLAFANVAGLRESHDSSSLLHGPPQWAIPLRR
ncbi:MAG TPA: hypothetical protein VIK39_19090 [Candidatus Angelobacter sp.]|jgi:hypothetical protein